VGACKLFKYFFVLADKEFNRLFSLAGQGIQNGFVLLGPCDPGGEAVAHREVSTPNISAIRKRFLKFNSAK